MSLQYNCPEHTEQSQNPNDHSSVPNRPKCVQRCEENPDFEVSKKIILTGEVKYPGVYSLLSRDEKISSVIKRAGGLSKYAYIDGVTMFRKELVNRIKNTKL